MDGTSRAVQKISVLKRGNKRRLVKIA